MTVVSCAERDGNILRYCKEIGDSGEVFAMAFLEAKGYRIIEKGFSCALGQIDIIAAYANELHFVEVKTRTNNRMGFPEEAVDNKKKNKISKAAEYYMTYFGIKNMETVIDVISLEVMHIENV